MDYTQFYCKECKFHSYDVFARGECNHPNVGCLIDPHCRACFRFELKDKLKRSINANIVGVPSTRSAPTTATRVSGNEIKNGKLLI